MFKLIACCAATIIAATALVAVPARPVSASNGAIVMRELYQCSLMDGDGGVVMAERSRLTATPNGKIMLTCEAAGVANSSRKPVYWDAENTGLFACATIDGVTYRTFDWRETVSASGNARLIA